MKERTFQYIFWWVILGVVTFVITLQVSHLTKWCVGFLVIGILGGLFWSQFKHPE